MGQLRDSHRCLMGYVRKCMKDQRDNCVYGKDASACIIGDDLRQLQ